jgi:glycyl-tRNA synthetase beta chain
MKQPFLFEIGCEEIPARFVRAATEQLTEKVTTWFQDQRISFGSIRSFATPRRLAVYLTEVEAKQVDQVEVLRGPAARIARTTDGSWSKAAVGFAGKNGVALDELEIREEKGISYVYAVKQQVGAAIEELLQRSFTDVISSLSFPKTMRWEETKSRFIRPVRWLVCLYGEKVIPITWANVSANRFTRGHRFLGDEVAITHPDQYQEILKNQAVIVDIDERQQLILTQLKALETESNWRIPIDPELLEEVTQLVEYPTILSGQFAESFLALPKKVLITTMREHQRYFPVESVQGQLLPYFVTIRNGDSRSLQLVSTGNEKVLRARLADAQFFYTEDKKRSITSWMEKLSQIVYQEELGSVADRVVRGKRLAISIANKIGLSEAEQAFLIRAATIAKFDQATHLINEFPELEGYMGKEYALLHGEAKEVAEALYEQVLPLHPEGPLPKSTIGTILSLADRLDFLASGFAIGLPASGSQDPYGFRKKAVAVIQLLMANPDLSLSLTELIESALDVGVTIGREGRSKDAVRTELIDFFRMRLKSLLSEQKVRYDVVDAVLNGDISNLTLLIQKATKLMDCVNRDSFKAEVEGFTRAANLATKADQRIVVEKLFESKVETALYVALRQATNAYVHAENNVSKMYQALASLVPAIHIFFDHVMVMVEDEELKANRLALLRDIHQLTSSFAAFDQLVFRRD